MYFISIYSLKKKKLIGQLIQDTRKIYVVSVDKCLPIDQMVYSSDDKQKK